MSRLLLTLFAAVWLTITRPIPMDAQERKYDQDALRIEYDQGSTRIVRGLSGDLVKKVSSFHRSGLESVFTPSREAVAEAKIFESNYVPGSIFAGLGLALLGIQIGVSRINDINPTIPTLLTVFSLVSMGVGATKLHSAYQALSKAVWWYNRELIR